jgi:hypothetical protein
LNQLVRIDAQSSAVPVSFHETEIRIVTIETASFSLNESHVLSARLYGQIVPCADLRYWISLAAYDDSGELLGTARHMEVVRRSRNPDSVAMLKTFKLSFGASRAFKRLSTIAIAISDSVPPALRPDAADLAT